jgi:hypothetical protein
MNSIVHEARKYDLVDSLLAIFFVRHLSKFGVQLGGRLSLDLRLLLSLLSSALTFAFFFVSELLRLDFHVGGKPIFERGSRAFHVHIIVLLKVGLLGAAFLFFCGWHLPLNRLVLDSVVLVVMALVVSVLVAVLQG